MLSINLSTFKADIQAKMKGTSITQIKDFYGTASSAAGRMLARIDPQETIRTAVLSSPFFDNVNDYVLATDYKGMIDIRPQKGRQDQEGNSNYSQTTPRQFLERLTPDSFSIRWNNAVRTLRSQRLPAGNVTTMDPFESTTGNGLWTPEGDAGAIYAEPLNFISGIGSLGMNLSGVTGAFDIVNSTAAAVDFSTQLFEDTSFLYVYLPSGFSSRFTSFNLRRGSSASAYRLSTVTTKADGTAFTDGWNFLRFDWSQGTSVGSPDDTKNTYRRLGCAYTAGAAINGFLVDFWTDAMGELYEMEYYSECLFRTSAGAWIYEPTTDSDLVNVGPASYEILKTEMMIDVTQQIRTGAVLTQQINEWRLMLNGQPQSRYVKDPPYHGLYADYLAKFPSSQIITTTRTYDFDV